MNRNILIVVLLLLSAAVADAERKRVSIDAEWEFFPALHIGSRTPVPETVSLPHTWNSGDVLETNDYLRTTNWYRKTLNISPEELEGRRFFLYFHGVNSVASVYVNKKLAGEHKGGYTAFCVEATEALHEGGNVVEVLVSNAFRTDVAPVTGDFNVFGGIHRPVELIVTSEDCISPLDYASSGVYIRQLSVSDRKADLEVISRLSLASGRSDLKLKTTIYDMDGAPVLENLSDVKGDEVVQPLSLPRPHLWNAKQDPYLYTFRVQLLRDGKVVDEVEERTGFRYFSVDPDKGFYLNGKYLDLYGFGKHEDLEGKGSAMTETDHRNDFRMILESGATALRLTHYPHYDLIYDLCDSAGLVVWTEIPNVGPGGFYGAGFFPTEDYGEHLQTVLKEMIRQKFNHPSVCFWGIFNELNFNYDNPVQCMKGLDSLAKMEDPSRKTAFATFIQDTAFDGTADLIAYNKYYGWYQGRPQDFAAFLDDVKEMHAGIPVGISEYGAGGSIRHHDVPDRKPKSGGKWHPEEYQAWCHEKAWEQMSVRPSVWCKFIWNFSDFSSSVKDEGDRFGINDKGLVTYDRKFRKDAFYFYKANWNSEPMIHITSKREAIKPQVVDIKVYTNLGRATLFVNGRKVSAEKADSLNRIIWKDVQLAAGENQVRVVSADGKVSDTCRWTVE